MPEMPQDFAAEARAAFEQQDRAHLILQSLEVGSFPWEKQATELIRELSSQLPPMAPQQLVVLFTGHRIDSPDRSSPRFPANAEGIAHEAILSVLQNEQEQARVTGIAGGANGGDILFLEACRELTIPFQMRLSLPEDQFISASVNAARGDWVSRFKALANISAPKILATAKTLPDWLKRRADYSFWARNNLWLISSALALSPREFLLVALWDGTTGDGPGGTEEMVITARKQGARLIHLDTRQLFMSQTIHTATR